MTEKGMSLLEILIVVAIFAVLGIVTTQAVFLTLQGSKKSESTVRVRENVDYALGVIERQLRNADSVPVCPNPSPNVIDFLNQNGEATSFSCVGIGGSDPYIASGSARLTSTEVKITICSFSCSPGTSVNPPVVSVDIEAQDKNAVGIQGSTVSNTTQIYLRNY